MRSRSAAGWWKPLGSRTDRRSLDVASMSLPICAYILYHGLTSRPRMLHSFLRTKRDLLSFSFLHRLSGHCPKKSQEGNPESILPQSDMSNVGRPGGGATGAGGRSGRSGPPCDCRRSVRAGGSTGGRYRRKPFVSRWTGLGGYSAGRTPPMKEVEGPTARQAPTSEASPIAQPATLRVSPAPIHRERECRQAKRERRVSGEYRPSITVNGGRTGSGGGTRTPDLRIMRPSL